MVGGRDWSCWPPRNWFWTEYFFFKWRWGFSSVAYRLVFVVVVEDRGQSRRTTISSTQRLFRLLLFRHPPLLLYVFFVLFIFSSLFRRCLWRRWWRTSIRPNDFVTFRNAQLHIIIARLLIWIAFYRISNGSYRLSPFSRCTLLAMTRVNWA